MKPLHTKDVEDLFRAILSLETVEECYQFFEDACTVKEVANSGGAYPTITELATGAGFASSRRVPVVIEQDAGLVTLTIDGTQILEHQITDYAPSAHQRIEMWRRHQIDDFGYRFES